MRNYYNSGPKRRPSNAGPKRRNNSSNRNKPSNINPSRYINKALEKGEEIPYIPKNAFSDFKLNQQTIKTLADLGFTDPTPIQDQAMGDILKGKDLIGLANTGTGKTATFLLPIIEKLSHKRLPISVLILTPTRELAQQIEKEFRRFSVGQKLYSTLVVGGANINQQIQQIQRGPHIVIGTPGRIKDLIGRQVLKLSQVSTFVLDEADRMCDMGFVKDIRQIEAELPKVRQTLCFSATITGETKKIIEEFTRDPLAISVIKNETNDHIEQDVIPARDKAHKFELLTNLLIQDEFAKVLIFGETKYGVQRLADNLTKNGLPANAIHGNKSQSQRQKALDSFKQNKVSILVATDVAARGLDIPNVTHVINFDQPKVYDDYVHRIGRTGRAGKTGKALTFVPQKPSTIK